MEQKLKPESIPEFCNTLTTKEVGHVFLVNIFEPKTLTYKYDGGTTVINVTYANLRIYVKVKLPTWISEKPGKSCLYLSNTPIEDADYMYSLHSVISIPVGQILEYMIVYNTANLSLDFTRGVFVGLFNYEQNEIE